MLTINVYNKSFQRWDYIFSLERICDSQVGLITQGYKKYLSGIISKVHYFYTALYCIDLVSNKTTQEPLYFEFSSCFSFHIKVLSLKKKQQLSEQEDILNKGKVM